jgi:hypothetical protein
MMTHDLPSLFEGQPGTPNYCTSFPPNSSIILARELVESNVDVAIAKAWATLPFTE